MIRVTAAIIRKEGRILACRRSYGSCAHLWEFPGGKFEQGESAFECVTRELREELNVEIRPLRVFAEYEFSYPDKTIAFTFIEAELVSGEPQLSVHEEMRWLPANQLMRLEWCPADMRAAEMLSGGVSPQKA